MYPLLYHVQPRFSSGRFDTPRAPMQSTTRRDDRDRFLNGLPIGDAAVPARHALDD